MEKKSFIIYIYVFSLLIGSIVFAQEGSNDALFGKNISNCTPYEENYQDGEVTLRRKIYGMYNGKCLSREKILVPESKFESWDMNDPKQVAAFKQGSKMGISVMECNFPSNMLKSISDYYKQAQNGQLSLAVSTDGSSSSYVSANGKKLTNPIDSAKSSGVCKIVPTGQFVYIKPPKEMLNKYK